MLVDLVLKCRDIDDIDVSISIDKYGSEVNIWTKELVDGFKMTIYGTGAFARSGINENNSEIINIIDPDLKMAEERMRRLLNVQVF